MRGFSTQYGLGTAAPRANNAGAFAFPTNPAAPGPTAAPPNVPQPTRTSTTPAAGQTGPAALPTNAATRNAVVVNNVNTANAAINARVLTEQPATPAQSTAPAEAPYIVRQYGADDQQKASSEPNRAGAWIVFALFAVGAIVLLSEK